MTNQIKEYKIFDQLIKEGRTLRSSKKFSEAIEKSREALSIAKNNRTLTLRALKSLGRSLIKALADDKETASVFEQAIELDPNNLGLQRDLRIIYHKIGKNCLELSDPANAKKYFLKALNYDRDSITLKNLLAESILLHAGIFKESKNSSDSIMANKLVNAALEILIQLSTEPKANAKTFTLLGDAYYALGNKVFGKQAYKKAFSLAEEPDKFEITKKLFERLDVSKYSPKFPLAFPTPNLKKTTGSYPTVLEQTKQDKDTFFSVASICKP